MITYVNTVLVSNKNNNAFATSSDLEGKESKAALQGLVGKFVFMNCDPADQNGQPLLDIYSMSVYADKFRIGVIIDDFYVKFDKKQGKTLYIPKVKWSNEIKAADIKSVSGLKYKDDTEDKVTIDFDFAKMEANVANLLGQGGIPVVLRLTFKDTPTRYRKWTESYDYYTKQGDTGAEIASGLAWAITREARRARVYAEVQGSKLILTAMPYDDNETKDSENFNAKVRFNANAWYSNPQAPGFASNNRYGIGEISKELGVEYPASAKNIRDHERTAQGYQGIMHRSKWYDPKPSMVVDMNSRYGGITLEFENMYRAADDIFRKTKQTVEIYASNNGQSLDPFAGENSLHTFLQYLESIIASRQDIANPIDNSEAYDHENFQA